MQDDDRAFLDDLNIVVSELRQRDKRIALRLLTRLRAIANTSDIRFNQAVDQLEQEIREAAR